MNDLNRWMQQPAHFRYGLPPIIVIPFDQKLNPFHLPDSFEVGHRIFQSHRPACVTGYQDQIVVVHGLFPRREYLSIVVAPVLAKALHRLAGTTLEMKVANCKDSH